MIISFGCRGSEDLYNGTESVLVRRLLPMTLWSKARRKLDWLDTAVSLADLRVPPGNRLEKLKGDLQGMHSIRINDQYRIIFVWTEEGPEEVEVLDYH